MPEYPTENSALWKNATPWYENISETEESPVQTEIIPAPLKEGQKNQTEESILKLSHKVSTKLKKPTRKNKNDSGYSLPPSTLRRLRKKEPIDQKIGFVCTLCIKLLGTAPQLFETSKKLRRHIGYCHPNDDCRGTLIASVKKSNTRNAEIRAELMAVAQTKKR